MGQTAAAIVSTSVSLTGTAIQAYGEYRQANEEYRQAKFQANQYKYQAQVNEARAGIAQEQGRREQEKRLRQLQGDLGSTYANWAGNGLLVDGGNSKDTLGSIIKTTTTEAAADVQTIKENTAMQVWGYMANAAQQRASAKNIIATGKARRHAAKIGMWSNLAKGVLWEAPNDGYSAYQAVGSYGG